MKRLLRLTSTIALTATILLTPVMAQEAVQKVILDTDMVELFDDGMAMILLDRAPNVDLLGVTVVAGNQTMPFGMANGARQLEAIGSHTPLYQGSRTGFRFWRTDTKILAAELALSPIVSWGGYLRDLDGLQGDVMADWHDVYRETYGEEPSYPYIYGFGAPDPDGVDEAARFLVDSANKNPGEITLVAIGPLTNVARAILLDPSFPSKIKQIVYMGGSFYLPGNSSATAEFNWWADPDAAKIAVRSAWGDVSTETWQSYGNQVIAGLEANEHTGSMPEDLYEKMVANTFPGIQELWEKRAKPLREAGRPLPPSNVWDLFAAAWVIDPDIVLAWNDDPRPEDGVSQPIYGVYIDVDTNLGIDYGRSTAFREDVGPVGAQKAAIENFIDEQKFWTEIVLPLSADPNHE